MGRHVTTIREGGEPTVNREDFLRLPDDQKWHAIVSEREAVRSCRAARGILNGLPWWGRLACLNFPVAVAMFFMLQSAGYIPSTTKAQADAITTLNTTLARHVGDTEVLVARLTTALQVMCENSARDEITRNNCRHIGPR